MARRLLPLVSDNKVFLPNETGEQSSPIVVGSDAWYSWLAAEATESFSFRTSLGAFTARRERKRHGWYWYAYRKRGGKLCKAYLGKAEEVTLERLLAVAEALTSQSDTDDSLEAKVHGREESTLGIPGGVGDGGDDFLSNSALVHLNETAQAWRQRLPIQLTPLIGREQEVTIACALLRRPEVRLLTLTGTGGVGKTRLGLQIATELLNDFADGVCFISLASLSDPNLVIPTLAQTFGLWETTDWSVLERLKAYLRDKYLLLLLDNFEHVAMAAPKLTELVSDCPGLKILVTSRAVLHLRSEHEFPVPPLALPDLKRTLDAENLLQYAAVALFLERAWEVKPHFQVTSTNAQAIAEICAHLDGLPLAIELAAARIKLLPPQALLARLGQRLQVLTGGARDMPKRQQTLRNTITWSYDLLTAGEQRLFRRLSVFAGGCTLEAIEAVSAALGDTALHVLDGVTALIDQHLVQQMEQEDDEPRLLMLETIREYGRECLITYGEMADTQRAHANYYLAFAQAAEPHLREAQQGRWFDRLEQEHDNLRAALQWFIEHEETEAALRLGSALHWFWFMRGYLSEGRQWLERALVGGEKRETPVRAWALFSAGLLAFFQDDFAKAETVAREGLALFRKLGELIGVALSLRRLGMVAHTRHNYAEARSLFEESLAICQQVDDKRRLAYSFSNLAPVLSNQGEYTRGLSLAKEGLVMFRAMDDKGAIVYALLYLAEVMFAQGEYAAAQTVGEEGLAIARELNYRQGIAWSLLFLGLVALQRGDSATARLLFEESLRIYREMGNRWNCAKVLCLLASIAAIQGDDTRAHALSKESLAFFREVGNKELLAAFMEDLAEAVAAQGNPLWAARLWGAAEVLRETIGKTITLTGRFTYKRLVAAARAQLSKQGLAAAWAEGRTMTPLQALSVQTKATTPQHAHPVSPPTYPAGLSVREVEVLRLVAQGLTDTQVAKQLVLSRRTVSTHLHSIYNKLGVTSRTAATRFAVEHQLL